ncbi:lasso peptide biosynthesis B2 protein [uncultured Arcticibacterium sp.]|uniref:lasso peptide biosynthesis B2 protein n=1 Tax=uncultured Arcticibacterium sp. TaxID=2173042 RepID=UPI0030F6DB76
MGKKKDFELFETTLKGHSWRLIKCHGLISLIEVGLYFIGLKSTSKVLQFFSKKVNDDYSNKAAYLDSSITVFNQIKERGFFKGKCLSQSLALRFLLQRRRISTDLVIGTYIKEGNLFAHAWLEKDGEVVNDHPFVIEQYKILARDITSVLIK